MIKNLDKEWIAYDKLFNTYLESKFGYCSMCDIRVVLEHRYLSIFMDVPQEAIIAIGKAKKEQQIERMKIEVKAMRRHLLENFEDINLDYDDI